MAAFSEKVYDDDALRCLILETSDDGLVLILDEGDRDTSMTLPDHKVRQLRLALSRYERERKASA